MQGAQPRLALTSTSIHFNLNAATTEEDPSGSSGFDNSSYDAFNEIQLDSGLSTFFGS